MKAWNKGIPNTWANLEGLEKGRGWWKGKKNPNFTDEKHPLWKGNEASYQAKHNWIYRKLGKADHCSFDSDHQSSRYHWANISGSYLRDVDDYASLCPKCHKEYDFIRKGRIYQ